MRDTVLILDDWEERLRASAGIAPMRTLADVECLDVPLADAPEALLFRTTVLNACP